MSYTARKRRDGEQDGVDYHFISEEEFRNRVKRNEMLEWAEVFGDLKGTGVDELKRIQNKGRVPILEIDVQGWTNARIYLDNAVSIFILPPTAQSLWNRLEKRGTDTLDKRWRRINTAKKEIESALHYHEFIINNDLETAYKELRGIVIDGDKSQMSSEDAKQHCQKLLQEFDTASWFHQLKANMVQL